MKSISDKRDKLEKQTYDYLKKTVFAENPDECPLPYSRLYLDEDHRGSVWYEKDLKTFKTLFAINDANVKIVLWNSIGRTYVEEKIFKNDFTADEYEFLMRAVEARKNYIYDVNVNKPIVTDRLVLRAIEQDDGKIFAKRFKDGDDFFMLTAFEPTDKLITDYSKMRGPLLFTIEEKTTRTIIGCAGLNLKEESATGWLDYYIFKEYRNKGYCKEAVSVLIEKAFNNKLYLPVETIRKYVYKRKALKLNAIRAWVVAVNTPSLKTVESCGFKHEATFNKVVYKKDVGWIDREYFYLTKEAWTAK